jgi:hypothetical protein
MRKYDTSLFFKIIYKMRFGQVISVKRSKGILPFKNLLKKKRTSRRKKNVWSKLVSFFSF